MKYDSIIFDLDGTLWEVIETTYKSANEIAKKYKLENISKETICNVFGKNKVESAKMYFPNIDLDKALKLIDEIAIVNIESLRSHGGNVYENVEDTLIKLNEDYELFIVSNTSESKYIESFLVSSKFEKYFKDYIAASELNISKAEAIQKIIKDNNLKKAIYVGDTQKDMEASKIANIPFVYATYGFGKDLETQYYINDIKELVDIIEKI